MNEDLKCNDCEAVFVCEAVEEGSEGSTPQYCPFCGGSDIVTDNEDYDDNEESNYGDEDDYED